MFDIVFILINELITYLPDITLIIIVLSITGSIFFKKR